MQPPTKEEREFWPGIPLACAGACFATVLALITLAKDYQANPYFPKVIYCLAIATPTFAIAGMQIATIEGSIRKTQSFWNYFLWLLGIPLAFSMFGLGGIFFIFSPKAAVIFSIATLGSGLGTIFATRRLRRNFSRQI